MKTGGRAAVIVPDGVLFGSSKAHKELRRTLVEDQKLDAVISLPSGVFKPYAGVSTAILFFTKTNSGGTDQVWFYDMKVDGFSLDDKRTPQEKSDLPDILARWKRSGIEDRGSKKDPETKRKRTDPSFLVPKSDIAAQGYDLSQNRYKEGEREVIAHDSPKKIFANLTKLEAEIQQGMKELEGLLK